MNPNSPLFKKPTLLLATVLLGGSLAVIAMIGNAGDLTISTLTFMAVMSLLLDQQVDSTNHPVGNWLQRYSLFTIFVGGIFFVLTGFFGINNTIRIIPFLLLLAAFISRTGMSRILEYWKPLLLLFILALPDGSLLQPVIYPFLKLFGWDQLAYATATFTTAMTNIIGIPATLQNLDINMPNAIVTVSSGCDGARILDFIVRLSIILVITFSVPRIRWLPTLLVGLTMAFIINGLRITLLTYLANAGDFVAFDFWHIGSGAKVFYLSTIILFCIFGYFQISQPGEKPKTTAKRITARAG